MNNKPNKRRSTQRERNVYMWLVEWRNSRFSPLLANQEKGAARKHCSHNVVACSSNPYNLPFPDRLTTVLRKHNEYV